MQRKRRLHPDRSTFTIRWLVFSFGLATALQATEIPGVVQTSTDKYATVKTSSALVPRPGDKTQIYFKVPGTNIEVLVASGRVYEITGRNIMVQIEHATGVVAKDQLVRITSPKPLEESKPAQAGTPAKVTVTATPTTTPAPQQ